MKLIVNLKLVPTKEQAVSLKKTLERANAACDWISEQGWNTQPKTIKQFALHKLTYHECKAKFSLTSQVVIRAIAKVADAYKLDDKIQRKFKKHGSIAYDDRIIRFTKDESVNLWTVGGRETIPFQCGDYQRKLLPFRKGEVDLVFRGGNYYLNAVCDVEELPLVSPQDVLGVDFGIVNLATDSDGQTFSGVHVESVRGRSHTRRQTLQKAAAKKKARGERPQQIRKALKRCRGDEANFRRHENHVISKQLVTKAKGTNSAIAIEDLKGIGERTRFRKSQRAKMKGWSFYQLRSFLEYKARLNGVQVIAINPRNTSRTCYICGHCEKANRRTQDSFLCVSCGHKSNADVNAALNIKAKGSVSAFKVSEHRLTATV